MKSGDLAVDSRRLLFEVGQGRRQPRSRVQRPPEVRDRAAELRTSGLTYELVAERLREEFPGEATITENAVAAGRSRNSGAAS